MRYFLVNYLVNLVSSFPFFFFLIKVRLSKEALNIQPYSNFGNIFHWNESSRCLRIN